jgi:polar amino acid transport system permease protein
MNEFIHTFFNVEIILAILPVLGIGLLKTLFLSAIVFPCSFLLGLLISLAGMARSGLLRFAIRVYIDFFRAFPPLVLLILVFYGLPFLGVKVDPLLAAFLALVLNTSSYYAEVQRTGVESVDRGQAEAARSTGLSGIDTYLWVVLPQALRNVMSPLIGNTIELVKLTAIASVVSYSELLKVAKEMQSLLFSPTPLVTAALIYFIVLWPFVRWLSRFERELMERD